jgi:hypothetical protein
VVIIDADVQVKPFSEADPSIVQGYVERVGWNPSDESGEWAHQLDANPWPGNGLWFETRGSGHLIGATTAVNLVDMGLMVQSVKLGSQWPMESHGSNNEDGGDRDQTGC